jgi:hypothetical protein
LEAPARRCSFLHACATHSIDRCTSDHFNCTVAVRAKDYTIVSGCHKGEDLSELHIIATTMPEVYEPKKRRGNAGKTGFRRTPRAKQPFWPGMDLNDNLIRPPSSRKKNASLEPAIDESPSKVHRKSDPTEDDPILSFDNDPPSHDTGKAIGLMTGDLSSSASAEEDATFSQQTTSPPTSPSGKKRPRRFRDVELLLEAANSSQESHNKITEIVPTRGTRSGRQFRSPQRPTKKSQQQQQQGIEINDSAAALPNQGGAIGDGHEEKSPEVFHKKSTEALDELEFGRGLVEDEVEETGRHNKKEKREIGSSTRKHGCGKTRFLSKGCREISFYFAQQQDK